MSSRLKREECRRTKHDSIFSKWEILIGSSDWEDYSLGKDGVERYRIHNLPKCCSCPGLYELGLAAIPTGEGRKLRKNVSDDIVVVYLGQADNVRTRLQHYGRDGSHLDHGSFIVVSDKSKGPSFQRGPGLFTEIFLKGYSIMFRWVSMTNKKEAEKTEAELLSVFDYAWNTRGNSVCRREDILLKLDNALTSPLRRKLQECKLRMFCSTGGININSNVPPDKVVPSKFLDGYLIPQVYKLLKSQPVSLERNSSPCQNHDFCGVVTDDGSICRSKPLSGRKRCAEHKGKRIMNNLTTNSVITSTRDRSSVCGIGLLDGSICMESTVQGRKQLLKSQPVSLERNSSPCQNHDFCGVVSNDGSICRSKPLSGRKRCAEHKGKRIMTNLTTNSVMTSTRDCLSVCGIGLLDGSICMESPVQGRKRCELHKGRRVA